MQINLEMLNNPTLFDSKLHQLLAAVSKSWVKQVQRFQRVWIRSTCKRQWGEALFIMAAVLPPFAPGSAAHQCYLCMPGCMTNDAS